MVALDERTAAVPTQPSEGRFEDLFRSLYRELHALTYRLLGDRQEAEDVLQEAFLKLAPDDPSAPIVKQQLKSLKQTAARSG